jgi:hypothetical protein
MTRRGMENIRSKLQARGVTSRHGQRGEEVRIEQWARGYPDVIDARILDLDQRINNLRMRIKMQSNASAQGVLLLLLCQCSSPFSTGIICDKENLRGILRPHASRC